MPRPRSLSQRKEIFWEFGKELTKDTWEKGECITSPEFPITDTCALIVKFYPAGDEVNERPFFKRIRTNTQGNMTIEGDIQLCHGITLAKWYIMEDVFNDGEADCARGLEDIETLSRLKIFHSLPDLCYRLLYTVKEY